MHREPATDEAPDLISALVDGEADGEAADAALHALAEDREALGRWHAYHLIGDVLRSGELAAAPASDRRFLDGVRARLADESAGVRPLPRTHARPDVARRRPSWGLPLALAAGVALAAVLVVLRLQPAGDAPEPALAQARAPVQAAVAALPEADGLRGRLLRDAQLDRYLRAHRDYGAAQPVSLPGGAGRSVETVSFER